MAYVVIMVELVISWGYLDGTYGVDSVGKIVSPARRWRHWFSQGVIPTV